MHKTVDLKKKTSEILVIHCSDPRFQEAYHYEIERLDRYHDLLVIPGASKALVDNQTIVDYVKLLNKLHHFNEVHILDHIDCGAFGKVADELKAHSSALAKAESKLQKILPGLTIHTFLLGENDKLLSST